MFRGNDSDPKIEPLTVFFNCGGLGDSIAALPAVLQASRQNTDVLLWCPDYFVEFAKMILPTNIKVMPMSKAAQRDLTVSAVQNMSPVHSPMRTHLTDYNCTMIIDKMLEPHEKNYLKFPVEQVDISKYNLPEKFVVVTTGFTAEVREWKPEIINEVVDYIISKGYTPVFLGTSKTLYVAHLPGNDVIYKAGFNSSVDYSKGLNLVNLTSLPEAAAICAKAKVVIGLDNGLLHVAGCTDVAIVGGFTTVDPLYRMPYRNNVLGWNYYPVVPPESLGCRFCQSNWSFVYDHNFTKCWYVENKSDEEIQCVKQTDASLYIKQLEKIV